MAFVLAITESHDTAGPFSSTRSIAGIFVCCLLLTACGAVSDPPKAPMIDRPLVDRDLPPDILIERNRLSAPPSLDGNRLVRGWRRMSSPQGPRWSVHTGEAVLEVVNLVQRARTLVVPFGANSADGDRVRVFAGPRDLGSFPLESPLRVRLPKELPLGRLPISLQLAGDDEISLRMPSIRPSMPAGQVEIEDLDILQSGWSLVEFVRPVRSSGILRGRFVPPDAASPEQRFTVTVLGEGAEAANVFRWPSDALGVGAEPFEFEHEMNGVSGFVRIRLHAAGEGPVARWRDVRIAERPLSPPDSAAHSAPRPRIVVVYVLDALRADAVGHLGGLPDATPNLDRLAAEGVTFTRHFSVAPSTPGSTAVLFTGRMFQGGGRLPDEVKTLAEAATRAGYRTACISANGYLSDRFGMVRGFGESRLVYLRDGPNAPDPEFNNSAERIQAAALQWLDHTRPEGRVFLYLHIVNPHTPYAPPEPYLSAFCPEGGPVIDGSSDTVVGIREGRVSVSAEDQSRIRCLYTAGLAYADAQIGRLWGELQTRYGRDDVAIIVTSDHGEELFDHDGVLHGYTLYDEQLHVPLIIWWPGGLEPARFDAATDTFDLHESLRALTGAPPSCETPLGRNLIAAAANGAVVAKPVRFAAAPTVAGGLFMARSDSLKLVWAPRAGHDWGMGQGRGRTRDPEYLFDLGQDPDELVNRAGDPSLEASYLRSALRGWVDRLKRHPAGGEVVIDARLRQHLEALGYSQTSDN